MEAYKNKREQKIVFIHGKGDGVLRKAVIDELKRKYSNCRYQDASFQEYGFGATMVTINNGIKSETTGFHLFYTINHFTF